MPQKDTLDNLRTPVCFRILSSSFTSVSIFSLSCYSIVSISVGKTINCTVECVRRGGLVGVQQVQRVPSSRPKIAVMNPLLGSF
jgi:hypothetical protein